jgi:asparagine synthase (glutamine-hydrolysing)
VFGDRRFDESRYIGTVVAATAVDAFRIQPDPDHLLEKLPHLVYTHDEPFGSLSQFAQYCVMELASRQVKVVLDGQGADEQLGGYLAYEGCMIRSLVRQWHLFTALRELVGMWRHHRMFILDSFRQLWIRRKRRRLIRMEYPSVLRYQGTLADVLKRELMSTNLPSLLHYEDRLSMAFSIESRVPYLDYRLVEYIASLPQNDKIRHGITKYLLRKAICGIVPDEIRCRMDKMGFVAPEEVWMRADLRPFTLDIIGSDSFKNRKYWDAAGVAEEYWLFLGGKHPYSPEIWRFVCTELWLRMFFDNPSSASIRT